MSPKNGPATDEAGRPIVAELGRPETPDETAERKAAASARRRGNQTTLNLVLALLASLGIVALIVLVVVRPQSVDQPAVDFHATAVDAQKAVDVALAVPELPSGWSANRAELVPAGTGGVESWQIGLLTPSAQYIGFVQGIDANATWLSQQVAQAQPTDSIRIDGTTWKVYDRRDADDPGNVAYALSAVFGRSTVVLAGTATDDEFATLAATIGTELAG